MRGSGREQLGDRTGHVPPCPCAREGRKHSRRRERPCVVAVSALISASHSTDTHVTLATLVRVLSAHLYAVPVLNVSSLVLRIVDRAGLSSFPAGFVGLTLTGIEYKFDALAWMQQDDCAGIPTIIALELHGRAVVRVIGEVEEDLILRCPRHGRWVCVSEQMGCRRARGAASRR